MKSGTASITERLCNKFRQIPLFAKSLFLIFVAFFFFGFVFFISEGQLMGYSCILLCVLVFLGVLARVILGRRQFWMTMEILMIGTAIYWILAVLFLTLARMSPSPFIPIRENVNRWVYVLGWPFRVMGILFAGLVFVEITSPTEFLKFGTVGIYLALLIRTIEYTKQILWDTIDVLEMQGKWPRQGKGIIRLREGLLKLRKSRTLATVVFRNVICWALPWAWLYFRKIQENMKGDQNGY